MAAGKSCSVKELLCVGLTCSTSEAGSVSWSQDGRVAVASRETVYVLTATTQLVNPQCSSKLPLVVSMATLPGTGGPRLLSQSRLKFSARPDGTVMSDLLDPLLSAPSTSCDFFKASDWSPVGCNHMGSCLLTALSSFGRLLVYSPPGSTGTRWTLAADISDLCSEALVAMETPESLVLEPPNAKRHKERPAEERNHTHKCHMACCVAFKWFPKVLPVKDNSHEEVAVVAMATRSGHLALIGLKVPLMRKQDPVCSLLLLQQLPLLSEGWACSLHWSHNEGGSPVLYAGCTTGQLLSLRWAGVTGLALASHDLLASVEPPIVREVWPHADGIAVECLCWTTTEEEGGGGGGAVLVAAKGSRVVAVMVDELEESSSSLSIRELNTVACHGMPVSGLCLLENGEVLSSSLDGSLQKSALPSAGSVPSHDYSQVTSENVVMETTNRRQTIQGIAVSPNSILAAVHTTSPVNSSSSSSSKEKHSSFLHFLALPGRGDLERVLKRTELFHWDVCQYLLMQRSNVASLSSSSSSSSSSIHPSAAPLLERSTTELKNQLAMARVLSKGEDDVRRHCEVILRSHVQCSLQAWEDYRHQSHDSMQSCDPQSTLCVSLMSQWLSHDAAVGSATENCDVCGSTITLSSPFSETCSNCRHSWKRCSVTLLLASSPYVGTCLLCGAHAHTISSLPARPGSWVHHLLRRNSTCLFCGGYFEQLL